MSLWVWQMVRCLGCAFSEVGFFLQNFNQKLSTFCVSFPLNYWFSILIFSRNVNRRFYIVFFFFHFHLQIIEWEARFYRPHPIDTAPVIIVIAFYELERGAWGALSVRVRESLAMEVEKVSGIGMGRMFLSDAAGCFRNGY